MNRQIKLFRSKKILEGFCNKYDIAYFGVFGSYARNEAKKDSDIDLLVDFDKPKSLFDLARVKIDLEDRFKREVDLVVRGSIKKTLQPYVEKDLIVLYEKK